VLARDGEDSSLELGGVVVRDGRHGGGRVGLRLRERVRGDEGCAQEQREGDTAGRPWGGGAFLELCGLGSGGAAGLGCAREGGRGGAAMDAPIEVSAPVDVDTFDPRFVVDYISMRASRLVHAGLMRLDPDSLEPRPYLARGWRWID